MVTPRETSQSRITCNERVMLENVRVSARRPPARPRRAHTDRQRLLADVQPGDPVVQNFHLGSPSSLSRPAGRRPEVDLNAWTQTRALTAAIRGTRGPRAKHLTGLSRTSDRRRRTTAAVS